MAENQIQLPHKLTLSDRKKLTITGVTEVLSYDDNQIRLVTQLGDLQIEGTDLKLKNLTTDMGQAAVEGSISALIYEEPRSTGGFWHRLRG